LKPGCRSPHVDGKSSHGGLLRAGGQTDRLNMVGALRADAQVGIPISGIGGISDWRDAVEFLLMG